MISLVFRRDWTLQKEVSVFSIKISQKKKVGLFILLQLTLWIGIIINFLANVYVAINGTKLKKGYLSQSAVAVKKLVNKKEGVRSTRMLWWTNQDTCTGS